MSAVRPSASAVCARSARRADHAAHWANTHRPHTPISITFDGTPGISMPLGNHGSPASRAR